MRVGSSWEQTGKGSSPSGDLGTQLGLSPVWDGQRGFSAGSRAGAQSLYGWAGAAMAEHRRPQARCGRLVSGGLSPWPADAVFSPCPHVLVPRGVCVLISSSSKDTSHTVTGPP